MAGSPMIAPGVMGPLVPWTTGPSSQPDGPRQTRPAPAGTPAGPVPIQDAHRYADVRGDLVTTVPQTAGGVLVLSAPDTLRNFLAIRNSSTTANLYLSFGNQATTNSTFRLTPNQIMLLDTVVPQDDLYAVADDTDGQISVAFSNLSML
jgi:hypothetical protein